MTLKCIIPITFPPCSHHSSSSSTALLHCKYTMQLFSVFNLWEWALFIDIPFCGQYSTMYLCVVFLFLCQSVPLNYIVNMQMIWTWRFRIYCLFCKWWLFCTPTSPAPLSIHVVVIFMFYDDVDISNEGILTPDTSYELTYNTLIRFFFLKCLQWGTLVQFSFLGWRHFCLLPIAIV